MKVWILLFVRVRGHVRRESFVGVFASHRGAKTRMEECSTWELQDPEAWENEENEDIEWWKSTKVRSLESRIEKLKLCP